MSTLNRRSFMRAAGGGAASMAASGLTVGCRAEQRQPNILITIADDQTYLDTGCYGSRQARTPTIDRLAGEGVRFTHAFTGTAMCAPMRQQFYTGIFPVRNGAYPNHSQIKPGIKTLPDYLQALGYRVGLAGKRHFGPVESYPFEWVGSQKELDFQAIREFTTRDPAQPYCILVCSHEPHGPHDKGDQSKYPPEQLTVPPYMVDTPETRQALCAYLAEVEYFDGEVGNCMEIVRNSGQEDNTLFLYCSEQGSGFPGSKWTCYDRGLQEAFVVRWPGRVQPGSVANAMIQGVDALPTLIEAAGGDAPAGLDGHSYLDVLEGKSDIHNTEVYGVHTTRGIIMGSECYPVRSIRTETHKLILNLNSEIEFRNVITTGQGYWRSWVEKAKTDPEAARLVDRHLRRPEVEFYDIVNDPLEMNNLAGEAEHQPAITSMKQKLHAWMEQQGDSGVETEMLVTPHKRS
jgi:uncharacterized sulfatase